MSAGSHTLGGSGEDTAPTPAQVALFLDDYDSATARRLTMSDRAAAAAAACWVLAYNARCELSFLAAGAPPTPGTALIALLEHRDAYLRV